MSDNTSISRQSRNSGIDLLRVLSMFYIVMLHTLGLGGIIGAAEPGSAHHLLGMFWQMWVYCALDIFALISGYVGYREKEEPFRYANYLVLWLQVAFTGLATAAVFWLLDPGAVSGTVLARAVLPITCNTYWYFTAYTGLFFLIPVINAGVRGSSREQLHKLFAAMLILFSVLSTIANRWQLENGFSCFWLVILYIMGAIAKKLGWEKRFSPGVLVAGIVICACLSWGLRLLEEFHPLFESRRIASTYLAPTHVCSAMLYLLLFANMKLPERAKKWIAFAAPGTFAVYLLNCNGLIWDRFVLNRHGYLAGEPLYEMVLAVLAGSAGFVVFAVVADALRQRLFHLLRVRQRTQRFADFLYCHICRIAGKAVNQ